MHAISIRALSFHGEPFILQSGRPSEAACVVQNAVLTPLLGAAIGARLMGLDREATRPLPSRLIQLRLRLGNLAYVARADQKAWSIILEDGALRCPLVTQTLLANSEAAIWTATFGGNPRSEPRCLTEFRASLDQIVDFANSVVTQSSHSHSDMGPRKLTFSETGASG
jgi:hypothetical protein